MFGLYFILWSNTIKFVQKFQKKFRFISLNSMWCNHRVMPNITEVFTSMVCKVNSTSTSCQPYIFYVLSAIKDNWSLKNIFNLCSSLILSYLQINRYPQLTLHLKPDIEMLFRPPTQILLHFCFNFKNIMNQRFC